LKIKIKEVVPNESQLDTLEEIHATLIQLRQEARTQRRFPQKLWEAIIRLTQVHSIETICLHLNISPLI